MRSLRILILFLSVAIICITILTTISMTTITTTTKTTMKFAKKSKQSSISIYKTYNDRLRPKPPPRISIPNGNPTSNQHQPKTWSVAHTSLSSTPPPIKPHFLNEPPIIVPDEPPTISKETKTTTVNKKMDKRRYPPITSSSTTATSTLKPPPPHMKSPITSPPTTSPPMTPSTTKTPTTTSSPPPPPTTPPQSNLHYSTIFQKLCEWKMKGLVERGPHRCCPFTTSQRATLVTTMAPFVALKSAAPITINVPPYFAKDRLNCNTQRWGGGNFFTGNPHDDLSKRPLVIDIFIVASEMDLMEARLWELYESVDYVIVGISPKNHRGDPQPNWFQHANEKQNRFTKEMLAKIILVDVGNCHLHKSAKNDIKPGSRLNHGSEWEHQLTQRDCLWEHGIQRLKKKLNIPPEKDLKDDTIFIFSDVDEVPDRNLMYHIKSCQLTARALPAHLRMRVNGHNFRVQCSDGTHSFTGASEISNWRTIKEDGGAIYRFRAPAHIKKRRKNAIHDAGVHLTWYGSMAFVDYKGFTHAEGGYMTPMWNIEGTKAGSYCQNSNKIMHERQILSNEKPLKFVRFWEKHQEGRLHSKLKTIMKEMSSGATKMVAMFSQGQKDMTKTLASIYSNELNSMKWNVEEWKKEKKEKMYGCRLPWIAVENPMRFIWFWGEGSASDIDRLADSSILNYFPKEEDEVDKYVEEYDKK